MNQVIELAKRIARRFEGLRLRVYLCPAGFPTIGFGRRCKRDQPPISEAQAEEMLARDMATSLAQAQRACQPLASTSDGQQAAVADFVFNLGISRFKSSTFRRRILQSNWEEAAYECKRWVWARGRKLPGLVLRREAEVSLMLGDI